MPLTSTFILVDMFALALEHEKIVCNIFDLMYDKIDSIAYIVMFDQGRQVNNLAIIVDGNWI